MESGKLSAVLVLAVLALYSSPLALAYEKAELECGSCEKGTPPAGGLPLPPLPKIPVPLPPVSVPPVVPIPSVPLPSVPLPSVPLPSVPLPSVPLPPIPVIGGGPPTTPGGRKGCPPPPTPTPVTPTPAPSSDKCPIDELKLGACVDVLGNEVHVGDANVKCCPLVKGVAGLSVAACLCTALKAKVLDLSVYVPIAIEVLLNCGCAIPPGYKCA
ncbi:unnamed protein product [Urochloa decumbens]|uniref:Hydrophobic seed protein domain-containing protein n=1 Tax=Urochloa decumbens TaxID=240449 RepID=A0ABC9C8T3_9POAL